MTASLRRQPAIDASFRPINAVAFKAWRVVDENAPRFEAHPCSTSGATDKQAAIAAALTSQCFYAKETLLVLATDYSERPARRHVLHTYRIRKRSRTEYWHNPETGKPEPKPALYPEWQFSVAVPDGFAPAEPWTLSDGDASGVDRTLIAMKEESHG